MSDNTNENIPNAGHGTLLVQTHDTTALIRIGAQFENIDLEQIMRAARALVLEFTAASATETTPLTINLSSLRINPDLAGIVSSGNSSSRSSRSSRSSYTSGQSTGSAASTAPTEYSSMSMLEQDIIPNTWQDAPMVQFLLHDVVHGPLEGVLIANMLMHDMNAGVITGAGIDNAATTNTSLVAVIHSATTSSDGSDGSVIFDTQGA